jgi:phenol hydroxylase P1 protein
VTLEIKTSAERPRRQTFANIARRFGEDRPASRYEEGVLDLQAEVNFHYRPTWDPDFELHDKRRTVIRMADWYALRDPRQYYYATWNVARAALAQAVDKNFSFVEERKLVAAMAPGWEEKVRFYLLPFRHYEWGANMNSFYAADYAWGTAMSSAAAFAGADRLGMAQLLGRVGLVLDGGTGSSLAEAKRAWLEAQAWQPVRRLVEDSFVIGDWFENHVAQNLAFDGIFHPLVFGRFDAAGQGQGATAVSLLTQPVIEWFADHGRWVDAVIRTAAAESADNRRLLSGWFGKWVQRAADAAVPLANEVLGAAAGGRAVDELHHALAARAVGLGLAEG